jgi:hypothetical protein
LIVGRLGSASHILWDTKTARGVRAKALPYVKPSGKRSVGRYVNGSPKQLNPRLGMQLDRLLETSRGPVLGLVPHSEHGQPATVSLATYRSRIHAARTALDSAARSGSDFKDLDRAAKILRTLGTVRLPRDGTVQTEAPVQAANLIPVSRQSTRRVARWLDALDDSLHVVQPRSFSPGQLGALDIVLKNPRFHPFRPPWDQLGDWLVSLYRRLLSALDAALQPGKPSALVPAGLLLLLIAAVAFLIARGAMSRLVVERSAQEERRAPSTPAAAERRADESAAAGNYREALRFLFLSTVLQLQAAGLLELRPGMTNREYLRSLTSGGPVPPELQAPLQTIVDRFDAVWYGHLPIDADGYAQAKSAAAQALSVLGERAA